MFKFCWHEYDNWGKAIEGCGHSFFQFCVCNKCGAMKRRTAWRGIGGTFWEKENEINESVLSAFKEKNK